MLASGRRVRLLWLLPFLHIAWAATASSNMPYELVARDNGGLRRRTQADDLTNNSLDTGNGVSRALIQAFRVDLTGEPTSENGLTSTDLNALHRIMTQVVSDYVIVAKDTRNVAYLLLGDIRSTVSDEGDYQLQLNTGVLKMDQSATDMPDEATLNTWVAEAIDQNFANALQDTSYSSVSEAKYYTESSTTDSPVGTMAPTRADENVSGIVDQPVASTSSKSPTGVIAGTTVVAVTLVGLLAMLLVRRHNRSYEVEYVEQQNSKDDSTFPGEMQRDLPITLAAAGIEGPRPSDKSSPSGLTLALSQIHNTIVSSSSGLSTSTTSTEHTSPTEPALQMIHDGKPGILGASPMILDDGKSLDGNDSDFTVSTEAGDSTAAKSLSPQVLQYHHPHMIDTYSAIERESFERDRRVFIRKDMMTSSWSGNTNHPQPLQNESVLEPSHLTASQARQERRTRQDDLLVVEQAHLDLNPETFVPTPPSQVSRLARLGA